MKKQRILALGALFVGFMGIAMMARMGRFELLGVMDVVQVVCSGACVGAAVTIFITSSGMKASNAGNSGMGTSDVSVKAS